MNPRDRILTALSHHQPDRVPFSWGFGPTQEMTHTLDTHFAAQGLSWQALRAATDDKVSVGPTWTGPQPAGGNTFLGIWGIRVKHQSYGTGAYEEFTDFPLAGCETAAQIVRHPWPDPAHYDYQNLRLTVSAQLNPYRRKAVQYFVGNPFEIYCWLTGLEEALTNLVVNPEVVHAALDCIVTFMEVRLSRVLQAAGELIDLLFIADDLGSQTGLLISPAAYRTMLQPYHRRLIACARRQAPHARILFHSDGAVFDILEDLVQTGIDVLEAVQTDAAGMEPERLKAAFGSRLSFHGGISVQQLLPFRDAATVARECRRLVTVLGRDGGYMAAPSHAIQAGTPPENVEAMLRAVLGDSDYAAARAAATHRSEP